LLGSRQDLDFNLGPRQDQKFIILVYWQNFFLLLPSPRSSYLK
jgi:hypothetical protein